MDSTSDDFLSFLEGQFTQNWKFCQNLLTHMLF